MPREAFAVVSVFQTVRLEAEMANPAGAAFEVGTAIDQYHAFVGQIGRGGEVFGTTAIVAPMQDKVGFFCRSVVVRGHDLSRRVMT